MEKSENHFGRVARHSVAQALLGGCMSNGLQFVAGLLQGRQATCGTAFPSGETAAAADRFLTREQTARLSSRCQECRQALNGAAIAWQQQDRPRLSATLADFREAQRRMRSEIVGIAD